jgi:sulfite exporter TauE/SafE
MAAVAIGIASSLHCIGMCGGISALLSSTCPSQNQRPLVILLYNVGRLTSYSLMGFLLGTLVYSLVELSNINSLLSMLRVFSGIILIMLGLYISKIWFGIQRIEKLGRHVWAYISPIAQQLIPLKKVWYALPLGFLWGWLPCGLVYSMLTWSLASGSGVKGGLIMFFFGLGTLPSMILMASSTTIMSQVVRPAYRLVSGMMIVLYGCYILAGSIGFL